jgi:multidrug transporter EmrE-like cation transporter
VTAVILSAALHAIWNFLLRRAGGSNTVVALSKVAEAVLLLPLAIVVFLSSRELPLALFVPAIIVAAILALANYAALTAAYRRADLSLVYPVARGGVFLFLPLLGFLVFDERLDRYKGIGSKDFRLCPRLCSIRLTVYFIWTKRSAECVIS